MYKRQELSSLTDEERSSCQTLHNKLITSAVIPAYQQLIDGLTTLKGTGRNARGLSYYPGGRSYYTYLLRTPVGTEDSAPVLEQRRYRQLAADSQEMQEILKRCIRDSYKGTDPLSKMADPYRKTYIKALPLSLIHI